MEMAIYFVFLFSFPCYRCVSPFDIKEMPSYQACSSLVRLIFSSAPSSQQPDELAEGIVRFGADPGTLGVQDVVQSNVHYYIAGIAMKQFLQKTVSATCSQEVCTEAGLLTDTNQYFSMFLEEDTRAPLTDIVGLLHLVSLLLRSWRGFSSNT